MEHTNNIDKALSSFKILAATQAAATENGDYKKGNEAFRQIIQIIRKSFNHISPYGNMTVSVQIPTASILFTRLHPIR